MFNRLGSLKRWWGDLVGQFPRHAHRNWEVAPPGAGAEIL